MTRSAPSALRIAAAPAIDLCPTWFLAFWGSAVLVLFLIFAPPAVAHDVSDFYGSYAGSVEVRGTDGTVETRDVSVEISEIRYGFQVRWRSVTEKENGRLKEKTYEVDFKPSDRSGIYAAAMQRNVFGHEVQQDPMKGEPYVWARLTGDTLTVFSLFITENGDYEMQQYDRSLTPDGLHLVFTSHRNGRPLRSVETELLRQ